MSDFDRLPDPPMPRFSGDEGVQECWECEDAPGIYHVGHAWLCGDCRWRDQRRHVESTSLAGRADSMDSGW